MALSDDECQRCGCSQHTPFGATGLKGSATAIQEGGNVGGFSPAPYAHSNQGWLLGAQAEWYFEFGQTVLGSKKASHCQLPSVCFKSKIHFVRA
jgi:hypothetical protein